MGRLFTQMGHGNTSFFCLWIVLIMSLTNIAQAFDDEYYDAIVPWWIPTSAPVVSPSAPPSSTTSQYPTVSIRPSESPKPSLAPSLLPSSTPTDSQVPSLSARPTLTPSSFPSSMPSDTPSFVPTGSPSNIPSDGPSNLPSTYPSASKIPSSNPSSIPTFSARPSSAPSNPPSLSVMPSPSPSLEPSTSPTASILPSLPPSTAPSVSLQPTLSSRPTSMPSSMPTDRPTSSPSSSSAPSNLPSKHPSSEPSRTPSDAPSLEPSRHPTGNPSSAPSLHPTETPSLMPSRHPSSSPSSEPSRTPSSEPSRMPSSSPTLKCHDNAFYQSPINNLTCSDHTGTNCIQWRFLGLNTTELGQLIENCPETCEIACGSFFQFSILVSYRLSNIPGLLDGESKKRLEEMSFEFLTEYVQTSDPDAIFELDEVEMTFQTELIQQRRMRALEEQSISVSVVFRGFTIGMTTDEVSQQLVLGIDDPAFTLMLRNSGVIFFADVEASSASEADYADFPTRIGDDGGRGASSATIVVSTLLSVSLMMFGIGAFVYHHRRSGRWVPWLNKPLKRVEGRELGSPNNWRSSQPGSPLSFGESPTATAGNAATGLLGLIASLSLSRSKSSTSADGSSNTSGQESIPNGPMVSPMSDESEKSIPTEQHPLSKIIPPMIVIDNIDDENDSPSNASDQHRNDQEMVPSKRIGASSAFLAALNECRKPHTPNTFAGMLYNTESFGEDLNISVWSNVEDNTRVLSPLGIIMDSDSDDGTSVASTPVHATPRESLPLRRSASQNAIEVLDKLRNPESLFSSESPMNWQSPAMSTTNANSARGVRPSFSFRCIPDADDADSSLDLELGPSPMVGPSQINTGSYSSTHFLPVIQTMTPENRSETEGNRRPGRHSSSPNDGGRLIQSLWSLSPIAKAKTIKDFTPRTSSKKPILPKRTDFTGYKRKMSCDGSVNSEEGHHPGGRNTEVSDSAEVPVADIRLEFEAPRKGQLGLVIEAKPEIGPTVHAIKDYSPLFGLVKKGDKIVEVDGKKTNQSTLTEITKLLAVRPGRRSSNLRIVVARPVQKNPVQEISLQHNHSRNNSYGSSSVATSNLEADDIEEASAPEQPADDLLRYKREL